MSEYYRQKRTRNLFDPAKPFKISRSKLDLFLNCPRCFYIDRKLGVGQPPSFPFNLNSAVDALLKKEFDYYRKKGEPHPLLTENNIDAIPYDHAEIDRWRDSLHAGIQFQIPGTNLTLTGGVDDVWFNPKTEELIIADYKATSKSEPVSLDAPWQIAYKRQAEVYQWLFRKNGFKVSNTAYFVYCNGNGKLDRFDKKLHFNVSVLPYVGDDGWVDGAVMKAHACLIADDVPQHSEQCDYCRYVLAVTEVIEE